MGARTWIGSWPVYRQLTGEDPLALGAATKSAGTAPLRPRTATADQVVKSVCPYCAVGCGQNVFVSRTRRSPRSRGIPTRRSAAATCAPRGRPACS